MDKLKKKNKPLSDLSTLELLPIDLTVKITDFLPFYTFMLLSKNFIDNREYWALLISQKFPKFTHFDLLFNQDKERKILTRTYYLLSFLTNPQFYQLDEKVIEKVSRDLTSFLIECSRELIKNNFHVT